MKNIILALAVLLVSSPVYAGQCSSGSCGSGMRSAYRMPVRGLFSRMRMKRSYARPVMKFETVKTEEKCGSANCCSNGVCSPKVVDEFSGKVCPAGCSVDECCDKCCEKECCGSAKCKCTSCK